MKVIIIIGLICLLHFSVANSVDVNKHHVEKRALNLAKSLPATLLKALRFLITSGILGEYQMQGLLNQFADAIFAQIQYLIKQNNASTIALPNSTIDYIPEPLQLIPGNLGKIYITNGLVRDLSALSKYKNPKISYNKTTKTITLDAYLQLKVLQFTCNYLAKILLITRTGGITGKVENLKGHLALQFNLDTLTAKFKNVEIVNAGRFSLLFSGHVLVDSLKNTLTTVITTFLHPLILGILQTETKRGISASIDKLNKMINKVINP